MQTRNSPDLHELDLLMTNSQAQEALSQLQPALMICLFSIFLGSMVFGLIHTGAPMISNSLLSELIDAQAYYLRRLLQPLSQQVCEQLSTDVLKGLHTYLSQIDEINGRIVDIALRIPSFNTTNAAFVSLYDAIRNTDATLANIFDILDAAGQFNGSVISM